MGCLLSCFKSDTGEAKYDAYKATTNGNELIKDLLPKIKNDSKVVIIKLKNITQLEASVGNDSPFVEMKLRSFDSIAGPQRQTSTFKPNTLTPRWVWITQF